MCITAKRAAPAWKMCINAERDALTSKCASTADGEGEIGDAVGPPARGLSAR
jgi:hypothetical protein